MRPNDPQLALNEMLLHLRDEVIEPLIDLCGWKAQTEDQGKFGLRMHHRFTQIQHLLRFAFPGIETPIKTVLNLVKKPVQPLVLLHDAPPFLYIIVQYGRKKAVILWVSVASPPTARRLRTQFTTP